MHTRTRARASMQSRTPGRGGSPPLARADPHGARGPAGAPAPPAAAGCAHRGLPVRVGPGSREVLRGPRALGAPVPRPPGGVLHPAAWSDRAASARVPVEEVVCGPHLWSPRSAHPSQERMWSPLTAMPSVGLRLISAPPAYRPAWLRPAARPWSVQLVGHGAGVGRPLDARCVPSLLHRFLEVAHASRRSYQSVAPIDAPGDAPNFLEQGFERPSLPS